MSDLTWVGVLGIVIALELVLVLWKQHVTNLFLSEIYKVLVAEQPAGPAVALKVTLGIPKNQ